MSFVLALRSTRFRSTLPTTTRSHAMKRYSLFGFMPAIVVDVALPPCVDFMPIARSAMHKIRRYRYRGATDLEVEQHEGSIAISEKLRLAITDRNS